MKDEDRPSVRVPVLGPAEPLTVGEIEDVRRQPGERLALECHWDHRGGSTDLQWNPDEEVCLGTVMFAVVN